MSEPDYGVPTACVPRRSKGEQAVSDPYGVPTGSVPRLKADPHDPHPRGLTCHDSGMGACERVITGGVFCPGGKCVLYDGDANTTQIAGTHYASQKIQPWEALDVWLTPDQMAGHCIASAVQYLARYNAAAPGKGGMEDVKKAHHYLSKLIELQS